MMAMTRDPVVLSKLRSADKQLFALKLDPMSGNVRLRR
jgi:hypothetical protein